MSAPTISHPRTMAEQPEARAAERDALLDLLELSPGDVVVDLQAAGGFLADGIRARFGAGVRVVCIEPTELRTRIRPVHEVRDDPLHAMASLGDASADAVTGLAGLHHSEDIPATLAESLRILRPGGRFAVCDVEAGSAVANWLNGYVDAHNRQGHRGTFLTRTELTALLGATGFEDIGVERRDVPWRFPSVQHLGRFFKGLFALDVAEAEITAAVRDWLGVRNVADGIEVPWTLLYARAHRPRR